MSNGIYVVVEQRSGKVQNVGLELIGEATRLKADLKDDVYAVLLGSGITGEATNRTTTGADKVLWLTILPERICNRTLYKKLLQKSSKNSIRNHAVRRFFHRS